MKTTCCKRSVRSLCLVLVSGAMTVAAGAPALAGAISQNLAFRLNAETSSASFLFAPFDASLGTLDSVDIAFDATRRHVWGLWNTSGANAALAYEASLAGTTFTLDGNNFGFSDLGYGPASTPVLPSTAFPDFLLQFLAGQSQFLAGDEPDFGDNVFQPITSMTTITDTFAASSYAAVLNLAYSYNPGVFALDASGSFAASLVDVYGNVTVTYGYTPHAVPETGAGVVALGVTLAGLAAAGNRLRRKNPEL